MNDHEIDRIWRAPVDPPPPSADLQLAAHLASIRFLLGEVAERKQLLQEELTAAEAALKRLTAGKAGAHQ